MSGSFVIFGEGINVVCCVSIKGKSSHCECVSRGCVACTFWLKWRSHEGGPRVAPDRGRSRARGFLLLYCVF